MDTEELGKLRDKAKEIRRLTIDAMGFLGVGHIGGAMSIVETLTILYYKFMNIDPQKPDKEDRDKLVLSKGHSGPTLYSILADLGFFPKEMLRTLNQGGTQLPSHCDMNLTPGIDMTTGSLGQGFSTSIGLALGHRLNNLSSTIYTVIGDGESNEGQVWEAAMAGAQYKLNNLIAFTDYNKMELDGYMHEVMDIADISSKWLAFGWYVQRIDGHDFEQLETAILNAQKESNLPSMIILDTIKGKGCSFAEGKLSSHNMAFNMKQAQEAIDLLQ
jgi:transketolase